MEEDKYNIVDPDEESEELSFEEALTQRVERDFADAKQYLDGYHRWCNEARNMYFNAKDYIDLRLKNVFPIPLVQEFTDQFVAHIRDKLFYANRPATVVGMEETDKGDADAKQEVMNWQDYKDKLHSKIGIAARDCALYQMSVAQVDFVKFTRKQWMPVQVEVDDPESQSIIDRMMGTMPKKMDIVWQNVDIPTYMGSSVKRVNPRDFFFTADKETMNDPYPVMVRSWQSKGYFDSKDYFFNQSEIGVKGIKIGSKTSDPQKREMVEDSEKSQRSDRVHEYVEWQGLVNKAALYQYTGKDQELDPNGQPLQIDPGELVWTICGIVDGAVMVRLDAESHELEGPNIIAGTVEEDESGIIGIAPLQKIAAIHKGSESIMGILLENFKQSVNAMWGIDISKIVGKRPIVNKAGVIINCQGDPNRIIKRIEQPAIAPAVYEYLGMLRQMAKDAYGLQDITSGKGDPNTETLGESTMVEMYSSLRMRDYLKTFEDSYIIPLYQMRNQINMNFLDQEYVYGIIGEGAIEWRTIEPARIRASVDFICESSTREANRAVMVSQLLHLIKLSPLSIQNGMPVRIDKMMKELCELGFTMKKEKVNEFYPMLRLEEQGVLDIDRIMVEVALFNLGVQAGGVPAGGSAPGQGTPAPGQSMPRPMSESEATQSANQEGQPQVRETM